MRNFLAAFLLFALLQTVMLALLFWRYSDINRVSPFMPALEIKQRRLESAPSPRMILIGGSNLFFGIDSPLIEAHTGYHVVNMGLLRSLRLDYILNQVDPHLLGGDLVVICLEYSTLNGDEMGEQGQMIMSATTRRLSNLRFLTWPQWKSMLDHDAVEYLGVVFRQCIQRTSERRKNEDRGIAGQVNELGDLTRYHDPEAVPREQDDQTTLLRVQTEGVEASIQRMNDFADSCRARGVDVMFVWPPLCRTHYREGEEHARAFHRLLSTQLHTTVVCEPIDMVFDDEDFIGHSYHLRGAGVQRRTQRLIDMIKAAKSK